MVNIVIKKVTTILNFYSLSLVVILLISACDLVTVDEAEDSGFDLSVKNFSDKEYNNLTLYMGYKDVNNNLIALDSLMLNDITIYKKGDGDNFNSEQGFSLTYPFHQNNSGLNKFNLWEPNDKLKQKFYEDEEFSLKANLEGKVSFSIPRIRLNGGFDLTILENGDLVENW